MLLNLSNIKTGGGIQVSLSFMDYLSKSDFKFKKILISKKLLAEIKKNKTDYKRGNVVVVKNLFHKIWFLTFHGQKSVFTLFGPTYGFKLKYVTWINGFAQPWILFPKNIVYKELNILKNIFFKFKFFIQKQLYKKSDFLVVEHEFIKNELRDRIVKNSKIKVANNAINQIFLDKSSWKKIKIRNSNTIKIGMIGRNYLHKNFSIALKVKKELLDRFKLKTEFYATLDLSEIKSINKSFSNNINCIGQLSLRECPEFYNKMDIIFFPSNLECFSATPIESVFMGKKLVCADYSFNKYLDSQLISFFTPNDHVSAAETLFRVISDKKKINLNHEKEKILNEFNALDRFKSILTLLLEFKTS